MDVDALLADLERWSAGQRIESAAAARERERWLARQAAEEARLSGLFVDTAERGGPVQVTTADGRSVAGVVAAVGRDFVAMVDRGGRAVFVPTAAVTVVRTGRSGAPSARAAPLDASLRDVLDGLAAERAEVRAVAGGQVVAGELRWAGVDVLGLRAADALGETYVAVASLSEVTLLVSG